MACITLPFVTIQAQQQRQAATTIEALSVKIKSLEDIQEISNVLIDYGRALDSRDFKAYSALFAKDGSWSGGLGTVSGGPPAIYDFMTSRIGGGRQGNNGDGNAPPVARRAAAWLRSHLPHHVELQDRREGR